MGLLFDMHVHTRRHSPCSEIDETQLIRQAIKAGLDGLVITEHSYQWPQEELAELLQAAGEPTFLLFSGAEIFSDQGDILVYGISPEAVSQFPPGDEALHIIRRVQKLGGVAVAAHPTRAGLSYDVRIRNLPFDAIETESCNLKPHEQRLAWRLAESLELPGITSSDAHTLENAGAYAVEVDGPIHSMAHLCNAIRLRAFRARGKLK
ncbi:MAG TPA: PHP domain-containing protein [Candidatus Hydrogenedentes bacterium]|nr:PHP domain-containing protein [Candidatus Hydrogenedentota bacterium]